MKSVCIFFCIDYCNGYGDNLMCKVVYKVCMVLNKVVYICCEGIFDCMCWYKEDRVNSKGFCNGVNKLKFDYIGLCKFCVNVFFGNCYIF